MAKDLNTLRKEIDSVDNEILLAVSRRMKLVKEVGEYKKLNNLPIVDSVREEELIKRKVIQGQESGLSEEFITKLWRLFINQAYILEE